MLCLEALSLGTPCCGSSGVRGISWRLSSWSDVSLHDNRRQLFDVPITVRKQQMSFWLHNANFSRQTQQCEKFRFVLLGSRCMVAVTPWCHGVTYFQLVCYLHKSHRMIVVFPTSGQTGREFGWVPDPGTRLLLPGRIWVAARSGYLTCDGWHCFVCDALCDTLLHFW